MTVFDDQRAALSRTPQELFVVGVRYCDNHYASGNVQNELLRTEEFDHAAWVKTTVTVAADNATDPLGGQTADTISGFAADGDGVIQDGVSLAASNPFDVSFWLRAPSGNPTVTIRFESTAPTVEVFEKQVRLTQDWQRFDHFGTFTGAATGVVRAALRRRTGDTVTSLEVWGAQLSKGLDLFTYRKNVAALGLASRCNAVDQGDGKRCYYSFPTCQDPANFAIDGSGPLPGLREYRFCRHDRPHPLPGQDVAPLLAGIEYAEQKIDPERAVTVNEKIALTLLDDAVAGAWDQRKANELAKVNTGVAGTFWRRFLPIFKNYQNTAGYGILKLGYVASGMTEALYETKRRGLLWNVSINAAGRAVVVIADILKMLKVKAPPKISEGNLLDGAMDAVQTTFNVDDAGEITPPGAGYTVVLELEPDTADKEYINVTAISGNQVTCQRGRWGTTARVHSDNDKFREVIQIGREKSTPSQTPIGQNPIDALVSYLRRAGIAAADIDSTRFNSERDTWVPGGQTADVDDGYTILRPITEQEDVESLVNEIRREFLVSVWVDEAQKVTGRVFAPSLPSETIKELTDDAHVVDKSLVLDDNAESAITRVLVSWSLKSGAEGSKPDDFEKHVLRLNADSEGPNGLNQKRQLTLLSKNIKTGDTTTPSRFAQKTLLRFGQGARKVHHLVEHKDDDSKVGDFVFLTTGRIQKPDGSKDTRQFQVTAKKREGLSKIRLELLDTGLFRRYGFIGPTGLPNYPNATAKQRRYGYIGVTGTNLVGNGADTGYYIW